ncbi:flippase [Lactobacillus delbrueckii subsp. bulgaricus]|nr:poly-gamma-glutamate biosynthesis protein [Lactobacillus delbrueckii subsp. bulgaricus]MBT9061505.1 poly-gamma-glutamate biosynthesis protein [Lactobacillus delbrueckii subsp. bulgaricus]MBT9063122.1 poly-gamma-glutamate biosynthesis protein [Lactobacillus delbrueckii subsp. bulgaricus]MBT9067908.1 poly-gamma-glutamate biosynthesis protein [Lactobacillus delbrueckii subsp. bulgaricus]MBT9069923.1 poly-gamma-glutamate biosynthesis protein [Lactobacillus delbrueckii subsp. bulgaricus]
MKNKSLGLNAFLNGLRSVLNIIFPIITFPYVSRVLSIGELGKYNWSNSYVSYFLLIAGLGIAPYAVREGAKFRSDRERISDFASQVFSINVFSTVISYMLLFLCGVMFPKVQSYSACIYIFSIQIVFTTLGTEWIYSIFEEYTYITIRSIVFKILSIVMLFVFVRRSGDYLNYAGITVFSAVGSNVLNYLHAKKFCTIRITFNIDWQEHLKPILIIFASSVATTIYLSLDTTLLGLINNNYVVGIYSVSTKMYNVVKQLIAAILTVTIPRFALLWGRHRYREYRKLLLEISDALALISIPAAVGVYMLAPQIVILFSSAKYIRAVSSLRLLCPALIFSIFSWIFISCVLISAKRENKVLIITVLSAVVNLILNLLLMPSLKENAAAITTSLSEAISMSLGIYYSRDIVKGLYKSGFWKEIFKYILGTISIVIICFAGDVLFNSTVMIILFDVVLSIVEYVLILLGVKNKFALDVLERILLRFK